MNKTSFSIMMKPHHINFIEESKNQMNKIIFNLRFLDLDLDFFN